MVCCRVCKSTPIIRIEASFGSSAVRVNTETVYSGRCEAGVVMTSVSDVTIRPPSGLLPDSPSYGRNRCWLLAHAHGTWLRDPLGGEKRRESLNCRKIEMANIMTEA